MRLKICAALLCLLAPLSQLHAGHPMMEPAGKKTVMPEDEFPYRGGDKEIAIGGAGFGSFDTIGTATRPDVGYALGFLRTGIMLYSPKGDGIFRGNVEALIEGLGGKIFEGPGSILAGGMFELRYNFVQPHSRFVPFFQIGGGGVYSDAQFTDRVQRLIGSKWSFMLESEIGGRFMLTRNIALEAGFEYRHISNADTARRNRGLNSLGGEGSICFFF